MKRLILLPVLMLGLSFACDQPYEEVGGIKIGCPYSVEFKSALSDEVNTRIETFKKTLNDSFFTGVDLDVLDGNIEKVSFTKSYEDLRQMNEELESILVVLSERWGKYYSTDSAGAKIFAIRNPNSEILYGISIIQVSSGRFGTNSITYFSKKFNDYTEAVANEEEAQRRKQLEGF